MEMIIFEPYEIMIINNTFFLKYIFEIKMIKKLVTRKSFALVIIL